MATSPPDTAADTSAADHAWRYSWHAFDDLDPHTLYALLKLRSDIFVVEQNCVFSDMDDHDQHSLHLVARDVAGTVLGTARLLPPGSKYDEASIGRVVVHERARGRQAGRALMHEAMRECARRFPTAPQLLWAQQRLEAFYTSLGFVTVSAPELEDGIWHVKMVRQHAV